MLPSGVEERNEPRFHARPSERTVAGDARSASTRTDRHRRPGQERSSLEPRLTTREFWFELLAGLDFYDAKILEHVYELQEGATTFLLLVRHLRRIGIRREALRRRVFMLAHLGLLEVVPRTKPLCIGARVELEAKIVSLIQGVYQRLGVAKR